jgi:hypothetical protein
MLPALDRFFSLPTFDRRHYAMTGPAAGQVQSVSPSGGSRCVPVAIPRREGHDLRADVATSLLTLVMRPCSNRR